VIDLMYQRFNVWNRRLNQRTTVSEQQVRAMRGTSRRRGVVLGVYDGTEIERELMVRYEGRTAEHRLSLE